MMAISKDNSSEQQIPGGSGEWDHLISMPQTRVVEFDPEIRRLSQEDKDALSILISGSKKYRAQSILVGVLMSFLALLLLFLGFVYLVVGEIVTEDSFAFVAIFMLVVWCVMTYLSFRLPSRRSTLWVRKLEYKQVVMFHSTTIDLTPFSPTQINPVKNIHVWEYVSGIPEQRTYNVHNNTYLPKDIKEGDLIHMYSKKLDGGKYSSGFFVSK